MNTKLTLSVDEQIIFKAKKYTKQNKKSLSQVIENYLTYLTEEDKSDLEISSTVKKWAGSKKTEEIVAKAIENPFKNFENSIQY